MPTDQQMYDCKQCGQKTIHLVSRPSHLLHLFLTIVTVGVWLPIWILVAVIRRAPQCTVCGSKYTGFRVA